MAINKTNKQNKNNATKKTPIKNNQPTNQTNKQTKTQIYFNINFL